MGRSAEAFKCLARWGTEHCRARYSVNGAQLHCFHSHAGLHLPALITTFPPAAAPPPLETNVVNALALCAASTEALKSA